jgi:plasmid maintenance system antidote protein VapI
LTGIPSASSIHPGDLRKTEFMEPLGLSSYRLAAKNKSVFEVKPGEPAA